MLLPRQTTRAGVSPRPRLKGPSRFVNLSVVRHRLEQREETLSPFAARSKGSRRDRPESPSDVRTEYQRDRDRIIHSKAFRRLKHKTQVFIAPSGDHYVTRLTHTLEVAQIARTIARALNLNEDLTEDHRTWSRPRSYPVRSRRRERSRRAAPRRFHPRGPEPSHRREARTGWEGAESDIRGPTGHWEPLQA